MPAFQQSLSTISEVFDPPVADRIHSTQNNAHEDLGSGSGSAPEQLDGAFSRRRGHPPEARVPTAVHHSGSWSRQRVTMAYVGIFLVYFVTTAQVQISNHLIAYTMSRFGKHHLAPTAMSASNIAAAVLKLSISRVTDARGRTKVFVLAILATTLGLFSAFIARTASMFAIGQTTSWIGYDLISFILALSIADITLIRDRGWIFGLSSVPQLVNTYAGPVVAQSLQKGDHWRSTYGISACVLPLISLPLSATLFDDSHKLAQPTQQPIQSSVEETKPKLGWKRVLTVMKRVLVQDDILGCLLIHSCAGMVLLPISLGVFSVKPSKAPHLTIELAIGICLFPALVVWERHQFTSRVTPLKALGQQTILGACLSGAAISASSACLDAYLLSYLQVVHNHTISRAGHLQNIYVAGSTFFAVCTGLSIRFHGKYTTLALVAAAFDILATGLAIIFRQSNASIWHIILNQLMLSFPGGTMVICGTVAVMAVVPHLETPTSLALFSLFTGLGAATGRAVAAALYINYMPKFLEQYLPVEAKPWVKVIFGSLHQQLSYPMGSAVRDGIIRAYVDFMRRACIFGLGFLPLAVFLASMWENINVKDKDRKRPEVRLG